MSFDLVLNAPEDRLVSKADLDRWFATQPHCEVLEGQAHYDNPDSGVHYMWEYTGEPYHDAAPPPTLILLLNYVRPLPFADEAADMIDALVNEFGFLVSNPQDDREQHTWDRATFLASYRMHAATAARSIMGKHPDAMQQVRVLPSDRIRRIWDWNRRTPERYDWLDQQGLDLFIPKVMVLEVDGTLYDTFVWPDAVPCIFPPIVEHVLLGREKLAPRTGLFRKHRATHELIPLSVLQGLLDSHYSPFAEIPGALRACSPREVPALRRALQSRRAGQDAINRAIFPDAYATTPEPDRMSIVAFSGLLDAELVTGTAPP